MVLYVLMMGYKNWTKIKLKFRSCGLYAFFFFAKNYIVMSCKTRGSFPPAAKLGQSLLLCVCGCVYMCSKGARILVQEVSVGEKTLFWPQLSLWTGCLLWLGQTFPRTERADLGNSVN